MVRATQATFNYVGRDAPGAARFVPIRWLRELIRTSLYRIGALSLYHRLRNRRTLTVVTLHRVLRQGDARWETALPPWTLDDATFDRCLAFFKHHYAIVGLDDVKQSLRRERPLPARSLLLTFDDGFADNFDYALPLLRKHGAPATVFVTSDRVGSEERLWTEDLLSAVARRRVSRQQLAYLHTLLIGEDSDADGDNLVWDIVRRGPELEVELVATALSALEIDLQRVRCPRQMLTPEEIAILVQNGISVGAHGKTHTAFPFSSDIPAELREPRAVLSEIVAPHGQGSVDALSFPHGAYTPEIADQALAAGYELLFTGEPELCCLDHGFLGTSRVGRVDVDARRIAPNGRFRPEVLATSLFTARRRPADRTSLLSGPKPSATATVSYNTQSTGLRRRLSEAFASGKRREAR